MKKVKVSKKLGLLVLAMAVIFGSVILNTQATGLSKDAEGYYSCDSIEDYRSGDTFTAPTCADDENKVFAGWYTDKEYTTPLSENITSSEQLEGGKAYAKFIDKKVRQIKFQQGDVKEMVQTTTMSTETDLRILAALDSINYQSVEFVITHESLTGQVVHKVNTVYNTLYKYTGADEQPIQADKVFGTTDAVYFAPAVCEDFDAERFFNANMDYTVNLVTTDGTPISYSRNDVKIKNFAKVAEVKTTNILLSDYGPRFSLGQTTPFAYPNTGGEYSNLVDSQTNANVQLKAVTGGIYYNGEKKANWTISKFGTDSYTIHCKYLLGENPKTGDVVTIDGQFGNDIHSAKFGPVSFELRIGDSGWLWGMYNKEIGVNSLADVGSYPHNEVCLVPTETDGLANENVSDHKVVWGELSVDGVQMNYNPAQYHNAVTKSGGNYYIYPVRFQGVTVADSSEMVVDCIIGSNAYGVRIKKTTFRYSSDTTSGGWHEVVNPEFVADYVGYTNVVTSETDKTSAICLQSKNVAENFGTIERAWASCIQGGLYVNGDTTPKKVRIDLHNPADNGLTYIWANDEQESECLEKYGITPTEGMTVTIDGVWREHVTNRYFEIDNLKLVFAEGEWAHYNYAVTGASSYAEKEGEAYFNELRLCPTIAVAFPYADGQDLVPLIGGLYLEQEDGTWKNVDCPLYRLSDNSLYFKSKEMAQAIANAGITLIEGVRAKVNGVYGVADGNGGEAVWIDNAIFVHTKTSECVEESQYEWLSQMNLVEDGVSNYVIVRGESASPAEQTAATELQSYLKKITGVQFPIRTDATVATAKEIVVGKTNRETTGMFDRTALGDDGYVIKTYNKKLWIVGGEKRGTLYGVYAYLEDYLGCRFYSEAVETVPEQKTIIMANGQSETYVPRFEFRDVENQEYCQTAISTKRNYNSNLWGRDLPESVGGGINFTHGIGGHTFFNFVDPAKYYDTGTHQEYFSLINGVRVKDGQLCLTNPEVVNLIIAGAKQWLAERYQYGEYIVSVSQNDTQRNCQCSTCVAHYNAHGGSYSSTLIDVVNQVARAISAEYPKAMVHTYAYQYTRIVPTNITIEKNVIVEMCTIENCFSHGCANYADGTSCAPAENAHAGNTAGQHNTFENDLKAWSDLSKQQGFKLYIYDYLGNVWHSNMLFPQFGCLRENMNLYARYNVSGIRYEGLNTSNGSDFLELHGYLISKLMKNPNMTKEEYYAHMDDYLAAVYGPGGTYIRKYIDQAQELVKNTHFNLIPYPEDLYPTTIVQKNATTTFPTGLTVEQVKNYGSTDWSDYWNWCTDVTESPLTKNGEEWFTRALALAKTEEQKDRIHETYIQVQYLKSYYLKRKIDEGRATFTQMLTNYIAAHPECGSVSATTITNFALSQLYGEYMTYNRALAQNMVEQGYEQFRPTFPLNDWENFNFAAYPMYWKSMPETELDVSHYYFEKTLWITGDSTFAGDISEQHKYWPYSGGIYINGQKVNTALIKHGTNRYLLRVQDIVNLTHRTYVTIDGVFGDGNNVLRFKPTTFIYMADNLWVEAPHVMVQGTSNSGTSLTFTTDSEDTLPNGNDYSCQVGGMYINGSTTPNTTATLRKSNSVYTVQGITATEGMRVTIDGIYGIGGGNADAIRIDSISFVYMDGKWLRCLELDTFERSDKNLWFTTDAADKLDVNLSGYAATSGGIYVDGVLNSRLKLAKHASNGYYIYFTGLANIADGVKVTIDGVFTDGTDTFYIGPVTYQFDADRSVHGTWVTVDEYNNTSDTPDIPIIPEGTLFPGGDQKEYEDLVDWGSVWK